MDVSQLVAQVYGEKSASAEDREKLAQAEFFVSLLAEQNIDVSKLTDDQITYLWKHAMENGEAAPPAPPAAAEEKKEEEKKEEEKKEEDKEAAAKAEYEKKAQAHAEWAEKRAAAEKIAEAEELGRIMARSYVAELKKIAQEASGEGAPPPPFMKKDEEEKKEEPAEEKKEEKAEEEKEASALVEKTSTANLDQLAIEHAFKLAKQAGVEEKLAASRLNAVWVLGVGESEKIASAPSFEYAVHFRALEMLEKAGFQVDWGKAA